jgi:hypothetical protein
MISINGFSIETDPEKYGMWKVQKEGTYSLATCYWFADKIQAMEFAESGGFKDDKQGGLGL